MDRNLKIAENVQFKKNLINFSVSLIVFLTAFFIISSFLQTAMYYKFSSEDAIIIENSQIIGENRDFSYYFKKSGDSVKEEFTTQILKSDIDKIDERYITVFTPKIQCEAFALYLNGKIIAVEGDIEHYNSNIWTHKHCYTVDSVFFDREINELKIVQYSRYMGGGLGMPFLIDGYQKSIALRNCNTFDIHQATFGIACFMFVLVILMISLFAEKRKNYLIMLASMIFLMIGYLEYFEISNIPFDYLLFKKIIVSSSLLAVGFGTVFFRRAFNKTKHSALIILCYSAIILIPAFFVGDMQTYKSVYTVLTFAVVPLIIYWGYISIQYYKKFVYSKVMLALSLACVFYVLIWNICEITQLAYLDSITLVIMPAFIVTVLALILIDFHELRMDVAVSNKRFTSAYKKSILDGLTKLYNAEYMKEITRDTAPPFVFVVYDIDDFKKANDTYGHPAGDEVLIKISDEISKMLRDGDILGRYGGDEFILLLKANSTETANSILERIRKKVEDYEIRFEEHVLKVTISIGFYIVTEKEEYKSMLLKADRALYQAKKEGKNKIILYNGLEDKPCFPT